MHLSFAKKSQFMRLGACVFPFALIFIQFPGWPNIAQVLQKYLSVCVSVVAKVIKVLQKTGSRLSNLFGTFTMGYH